MADKIRNFFEKKKRDAKCKGQGYRLNESSHKPSKSKEEVKVQERIEPTDEAKQAGLAALARLANKSTSHQGFFNAFMDERKLRKQGTSSAVSASLSEEESEVTIKEFLAVQGVYFKCPLVGPEILPKEEWKIKIKDFLYEQLEEEKGFTSCLMIHTLNKNREKIDLCVETLCTYLQNIISHPDEEKYKKIRVLNRVFQERLSRMIGVNEFLEAAGFSKQRLAFHVCEEEEEFYVFSAVEPDIPHLELMIDSLRNAETIPLELHRNVQVLKPSQAEIMVQLPDDFYALTPEELKREQQKRSESLACSMQLRTKAMREKEEQREIRKYRYTLLRIRFPNGVFLQGTFGIYERFGVVREFVRECLAESNIPFNLATALGSPILESEDEKTLLELKLVPAVILIFASSATHTDGKGYLLQDLQEDIK